MADISKTLAAVFVVCGVAFSWALSSQFAKSALNINIEKFYAPYSLVWFNTIFMIVCYPIFLLYDLIGNGRTMKESRREAAMIFGDSDGSIRISNFIARVMLFLILWVAPNYSYTQSLGHISASAASVIMSANVVIVCAMGWVVLNEPFSWVKLIAAVFSIAGVAVVSIDKKFAGNLIGIGLVIFSAFTAAIYKVLFKRINGNASLGQVSLFMSSLGLMNLTLNFIPTAVLVWLQLDHIEWDYIPWLPLIGSALLALIFNFLVNFGIALLDPLVISIGMLCGIPVSAVVDIVFREMAATHMFLAGSSLIVLAFILTVFPVDAWVLMRQRSPNASEQPDPSIS